MLFKENKIGRVSIEIVSSTGRLRLTEFVPSDATEMFDLINRNRDHLSQYGDETAAKYPAEDAALQSIVQPKNPKKLRFAIRLKAENTFIGSINLTPNEGDTQVAEIGYYLGSEFTSKGYMAEAVMMLTEYALNELGYEKLFGKVVNENVASMRVLEKAGYALSGSENGKTTLTKQK